MLRLSRARLRNECLQKVIRLLSLSPEGRRRGGKAWGRGRIIYAQLGIGELGAVYEGLLSYSGFFAKETLYEVHAAGSQEMTRLPGLSGTICSIALADTITLWCESWTPFGGPVVQEV